ncbi:MAG TPA: sigma-70 family RNA polymerase sigma factor [Actinomycetota bacterium]|nr:sigma-70 family RNA polymerase sigma factor [Actinomycetota bacterium]
MSPDEADFRQMYEHAFPTVYRVAYRFCGRREAAEDATQEAFARAFERWSRLRGRPWIVGWVLTTALNVLRRAARRTREVARQVDAEPTGEPDVDEALDLWRAIAGLPRRQAEAVVLYYLLDLPVGEVAEAMGCREGTAKTHLDRARRRLVGVLEPSDARAEEDR